MQQYTVSLKKSATIDVGPLGKLVPQDDIAAVSVPGSGRSCCARDVDDNLYGGIR